MDQSSRAARTLLGLAFLMLGAALAVAFALLTLGLMSPLLTPGLGLPTGPAIAIGSVLGLLLVGAVGAVPAVRRIEGVAVESMLGVVFDGGTPAPARRWGDRIRSTGWLVVHLVSGAVLVAAAVSLPALGLEVSAWLVAPGFLVAFGVGVVLVVGVRRLAVALLGPSARERIEGLERQATDLGERNRVAREIHDSVGHALSLVAVQSAAARRVQETDPEFVSEALGSIEDAARRAADELDHVLGLLSSTASGDGVRSPVPDLAGLPDLAAAAHRAGLAVTLENRLADDDLAALSPVASRELYRVAQEGLSNAMRHGSGSCRVLVVREAGQLRLEITNAAAGGPTRRRGGRGIPGIVDRARALGGTATSVPVDGGWRLYVVLPWVAGR